MDERVWRIVVLIVLIVAGYFLFRPTGRGRSVCGRCGFPARSGTPACPRCGRALDMTSVDLGRLENMRRRGEISEEDYRQRKLALIREQDADDRET